MSEFAWLVFCVVMVPVAVGWIYGRNDVDPDEDPQYYKDE